MRIVGGEFRGRTLAGPSGMAIRPTTDRTRETLFNILAHSYPDVLKGTRVLDLFAGTGALGFEALSRGARFTLFVEQGVEGRSLIQKNIETLQVSGRTKLFRRDATRLGTSGTIGQFGLVFADPPYGKGLGEQAFQAAAGGGWLAPGALMILEETAEADPQPGPRFAGLDKRRIGDTHIHFFRYDGA